MEIGELSGIQVIVSQETYEEMMRKKMIKENKILKEQQEEIERLNNIIEKEVEYIKENESVDLYDDVGSEFIRNLLDILNGRSDE